MYVFHSIHTYTYTGMSVYRGADKEAVDEDSATPLLHAAAWGRSNAVKVLLQGGAQANTVDKDGKSAVYWAAEEGHVDVLNVSQLCVCVCVYVCVCECVCVCVCVCVCQDQMPTTLYRTNISSLNKRESPYPTVVHRYFPTTLVQS